MNQEVIDTKKVTKMAKDLNKVLAGFDIKFSAIEITAVCALLVDRTIEQTGEQYPESLPELDEISLDCSISFSRLLEQLQKIRNSKGAKA